MLGFSRPGSLALIILLFFGTVSCTPKDSVSKATQNFFTAVNKGEYDKAAAYVNLPGGACLTCHNQVKAFKEVIQPGQLEQVRINNLEVTDENASGFIEFTTSLGRVAQTVDKVMFSRGAEGSWKINYVQIAKPDRWRVREPEFARSYEDIPNKPRPEPKIDVRYELILPQAGYVMPITDNPLKATEKDAKPHIFWSNSVKAETNKVTFSPAIISFIPDNEDPAVLGSTGTFNLGGWLVNNSDRKVTKISNLRITMVLNAQVVGRTIVPDEFVDLPQGKMQFKEYHFPTEWLSHNANMNQVKLTFELSAN